MNIDRLIEGLQILNKYFDAPDRAFVRAEHDIIGVNNTDKPISTEDLTKLYALGWLQPDVEQPEEEEGTFSEVSAEYDPDESWVRYV
jgi:hypothetical protein